MIVDACRRQVHHHHSGLGIALEVAGIFEACRADARRKSEISVVGGRDRLLVVLDLDHAGHWTEDFLPRNPHAVVDPGEQGRLQIEAGRLPIENLAAPMELRTLVLANGDVPQVTAVRLTEGTISA